jgi:serine carboxypeptidase-like clade 1
MAVPYTGSEAWTRAMGYKVIDVWRPWYLGRQVAGCVLSFFYLSLISAV